MSSTSSTSVCCSVETSFERELSDQVVKTFRCSACKTYWLEYATRDNSAEPPWNSPGTSADFLSALRSRREIQANLILDLFSDLFDRRTVLDYGCGQGVFLSRMIDRGLDGLGADLQLLPVLEHKERFVLVPGPWDWPRSVNAQVLVMLDVLEHVPNPMAFLTTARDQGVRDVLIKVPIVSGPLGRGATLAAKLGTRGIWDALILKHDPAPHLVFHTREGLERVLGRAGFRLIRHRSIPEVGPELPNRVRVPGLALARPFLGLAGQALQLLGTRWSDTGVFYFRRADA